MFKLSIDRSKSLILTNGRMATGGGTISRDNKNETREREICIRISLGNSDQVRQRNVKRPTTILIFRVI